MVNLILVACGNRTRDLLHSRRPRKPLSYLALNVCSMWLRRAFFLCVYLIYEHTYTLNTDTYYRTILQPRNQSFQVGAITQIGCLCTCFAGAHRKFPEGLRSEDLPNSTRASRVTLGTRGASQLSFDVRKLAVNYIWHLRGLNPRPSARQSAN